jgi:hypothetical protein
VSVAQAVGLLCSKTSSFILPLTIGWFSDPSMDDLTKISRRPEINSPTAMPRFDLSRIDDGIVSHFVKAWRYAKSGTSDVEGLVLIFRKPDGSYVASLGRFTNEYKKVTFAWQPNAIAIVHTHPNDMPPEPNGNDFPVADKLRVPILTITNSGMFMYSPETRKITKVNNGLDWLEGESKKEK